MRAASRCLLHLRLRETKLQASSAALEGGSSKRGMILVNLCLTSSKTCLSPINLGARFYSCAITFYVPAATGEPLRSIRLRSWYTTFCILWNAAACWVTYLDNPGLSSPKLLTITALWVSCGNFWLLILRVHELAGYCWWHFFALGEKPWVSEHANKTSKSLCTVLFLGLPTAFAPLLNS